MEKTNDRRVPHLKCHSEASTGRHVGPSAVPQRREKDDHIASVHDARHAHIRLARLATLSPQMRAGINDSGAVFGRKGVDGPNRGDAEMLSRSRHQTEAVVSVQRLRQLARQNVDGLKKKGDFKMKTFETQQMRMNCLEKTG